VRATTLHCTVTVTNVVAAKAPSLLTSMNVGCSL